MTYIWNEMYFLIKWKIYLDIFVSLCCISKSWMSVSSASNLVTGQPAAIGRKGRVGGGWGDEYRQFRTQFTENKVNILQNTEPKLNNMYYKKLKYWSYRTLRYRTEQRLGNQIRGKQWLSVGSAVSSICYSSIWPDLLSLVSSTCYPTIQLGLLVWSKCLYSRKRLKRARVKQHWKSVQRCAG